MRQRSADRFAGDELLAHQAHCHVDTAADQRFAAARDDAGERTRQSALGMRRHELSRQQQAPGGRIDEQRSAASDVRFPVGITDLVADQRVARGRIWNAQQRLREAHQRDTFLRRQRELLHQALDEPFAPNADLARAQPARQGTRQRMRSRRFAPRQPGRINQRGNALRLGPTRRGRDRCAQWRLRPCAGKILERLWPSRAHVRKWVHRVGDSAARPCRWQTL